MTRNTLAVRLTHAVVSKHRPRLSLHCLMQQSGRTLNLFVTTVYAVPVSGHYICVPFCSDVIVSSVYYLNLLRGTKYVYSKRRHDHIQIRETFKFKREFMSKKCIHSTVEKFYPTAFSVVPIDCSARVQTF